MTSALPYSFGLGGKIRVRGRRKDLEGPERSRIATIFGIQHRLKNKIGTLGKKYHFMRIAFFIGVVEAMLCKVHVKIFLVPSRFHYY